MTILVRVGTIASVPRFALELVKPSSVDKTGNSSSATVSSLGSVEFSACESLSLNNVFSAEYDNYMIVIRSNNNSTDNDFNARLRVSGTDATGSNYTYQYVRAVNTVVDAGRATITNFILGTTSNDQRHGFTVYLYGPNLAQPTALRSLGADALNNAQIIDFACTHSLSTSYDGMTIYPNAGSFSGRVAVYGMRG